MAVINNIQRGSVSLSNLSSSVNATITAVDTSKTFVLFSFSSTEDTAPNGMIACELTSSTNISFTRSSNPGIFGSLTIYYQVVEFSSGVSVQRGSVTNASFSGTPESQHNITITSVDTSKSFAFISQYLTGGTMNFNDYLKVRLTSSTNLQLAFGTSDSLTNTGKIAWQVIEFDECVVQSGDFSILANSTTGTATVSSFDTSKALLITNNSSTQVGSEGQVGSSVCHGEITNSTTLTFTRGTATYTLDPVIAGTYFLVEFTGSQTVQKGTGTFSGTSTNISLPTSVNASKTMVTLSGGNEQCMGYANYTSNDNRDPAMVAFTSVSSSGFTIERASNPTDMGYSWFAVSFGGNDYQPRPSGGGGGFFVY